MFILWNRKINITQQTKIIIIYLKKINIYIYIIIISILLFKLYQ